MLFRLTFICSILYLVCFGSVSQAEDGYDLWLRYQPLEKSASSKTNKIFDNLVFADSTDDPTLAIVQDELQRGFKAFLGKPLAVRKSLARGSLLIARINQLDELNVTLEEGAENLGPEGFYIKSLTQKNKKIVLLTANTNQGLLYGAFALLQHIQRLQPLESLAIRSRPSTKLRLLNHWDNLDRTVERGYAGQSIWDWWHLPDVLDKRYEDYARANASIGINGTVLNNVNAKAESLSPRYIEKSAALAEVFQPYGIRVYLSARFSAPIDIGGLETADPLDPKVKKWWKDKVKEIYREIPNFGGFLVKANSEGQPGPQDYKRSHADGANMLAEALAPYNGIVMWRAFVYSEFDQEDRAKQAFNEFLPLDGRFADNVLVQVKNGPIDFQPREPFHPMFGAMKTTPLMLELQITKEYLGFSTHLAYLGPLYEEVLKSDTYAKGEGSSVAKVVDGGLYEHTLSGIAGVANIGSHRNWSGSIFDQANWFVFGRMAWDPYASSEDIAKEWLELTFSNKPKFVNKALSMMMRSREAVVNYMTPLGLAHQMDTGHHYGPGPWVEELARPEWNPVYYHRASEHGIGFDRTEKGSNAISQYAPQVSERYADPKLVEEEFLLWFHHLPWHHKMENGKTLWEELVSRYDSGVKEIEQFQKDWESLKPYVDEERFHSVKSRLKVQLEEAHWWRDASIAYFSVTFNLPLPKGVRAPAHSLQYYKSLDFPFAPGN